MPSNAGSSRAAAGDGAGSSSGKKQAEPAKVKCRSIASLFGLSNQGVAANGAVGDDTVEVRAGKRKQGRPPKEQPPAPAAAAAAAVAGEADGTAAGEVAEHDVSVQAQAGPQASVPAEQQLQQPAPEGDDSAPPAKKRREANNPMAVYRKYLKPAAPKMNTKGEPVKTVHCEVCEITILDNSDTVKKHTGYQGRDEDGLPVYDPNNRHVKKVKLHEDRLRKIEAGVCDRTVETAM